LDVQQKARIQKYRLPPKPLGHPKAIGWTFIDFLRHPKSWTFQKNLTILTYEKLDISNNSSTSQAYSVPRCKAESGNYNISKCTLCLPEEFLNFFSAGQPPHAGHNPDAPWGFHALRIQ
jgi:hypothetical protein